MPSEEEVKELASITSKRGQPVSEEVLNSIASDSKSSEEKFYREDQSRDEGGKFAPEGGGEKASTVRESREGEELEPRGETGAYVDYKTGETLQQSNVGVPVKEQWLPNLFLDHPSAFGDREVTMVHTHPDEASLSDGDWATLGTPNVRRVEAVTKSGVTYSVTKPEGYEDIPGKWEERTPRKIRDKWAEFENAVTPEDYESKTAEQIIEEINVKMAEHFGFAYEKSVGQEKKPEKSSRQEKEEGVEHE